MQPYTTDELVKTIIDTVKACNIPYSQVSEQTGIPLSTIQKIFSGNTSAPRYKTMKALYDFAEELDKSSRRSERAAYEQLMRSIEADSVREPGPRYGLISGTSALKDDRNGSYTIDDFYNLPNDVKVELINGVFYNVNSPGTIHQRISSIIYHLLESYIESNKGNCIPFLAPTSVIPDESDNKTLVQPDLFVVCDREKITKKNIVGAPDYVIEIVSPSSFTRDAYDKLSIYKRAGVREYWIIIPEDFRVIVYFFEKSPDPILYTFEHSVPVNIWDGNCVIDFKQIYDKISFLLNEN